mmetsp:Transcript_47741/g.149658  ORF Transcript_47741/g.149658 Transcript_47741/m.149658 type:complete len:139 (+) Transcript_47741:473-889(+)
MRQNSEQHLSTSVATAILGQEGSRRRQTIAKLGDKLKHLNTSHTSRGDEVGMMEDEEGEVYIEDSTRYHSGLHGVKNAGSKVSSALKSVMPRIHMTNKGVNARVEAQPRTTAEASKFRVDDLGKTSILDDDDLEEIKF